MILGLSHSKNKRYKKQQAKILSNMSSRADNMRYDILYSNSEDIFSWRQSIKKIEDTTSISYIVIMDERVPAPVVFRSGEYEDLGIADNIYGDIDMMWQDSNRDGRFCVEEMPDDYYQRATVSRLVPYCKSYIYPEMGFWEYLIGLFVSLRDKDSARTYSCMLDYWYDKFSTTSGHRPSHSFIATSDKTAVDPEHKDIFSFDVKAVRDLCLFKLIFNITNDAYYVEDTDPEETGGMHDVWYSGNLGTLWHVAHSAPSRLGDFGYNSAYNKDFFIMIS